MSGDDQGDQGDVCPKRFGLNFDPPAIVLEYLHVSTGKLFHRKIGLRRLRPSSDATRVAEKMRQKNEQLLAEDKVSFEQLVSLVKKLQEELAEKALPAIPEPEDAPARQDVRGFPDENAPYQADPDADLNKLSIEELKQHKARMDVEFYQNQKKKGDAEFVYDVAFDPAPNEDAQDCGWDSDEDLDEST